MDGGSHPCRSSLVVRKFFPPILFHACILDFKINCCVHSGLRVSCHRLVGLHEPSLTLEMTSDLRRVLQTIRNPHHRSSGLPLLERGSDEGHER